MNYDIPELGYRKRKRHWNETRMKSEVILYINERKFS